MPRDAQSSSQRRWLPQFVWGCLMALLGWQLVTVASHVWERLHFPYDLLYWPDDYYLTTLLRIDLGESPYGNPADANSWIYMPGGPYLGWLLLKPLGLVRSFFAHKLLSQIWLVVAVLLATGLGRGIMGSELGAAPSAAMKSTLRWASVGLGMALALAAYMNPVADSLHPTNLELAVLAAASWTAFAAPRLSPGRRLALWATLPVLALCFKQTGAVAVTASLALVGVVTPGIPRRERALLVASAALSPALVFCAMWLTWGHDFIAWVWEIPSAAGIQSFKLKDFKSGIGILLYPMLLLVLFRCFLALRHHRQSRNGAYLRAALPTLCYTPLAIVALFKSLGGPNNLMVLLFLYSMLGAPLLFLRANAGLPALQAAHSLVLAVLCLSIWRPTKRLPAPEDYTYGRRLCAYVHARERCGERVYLGRGAVCYLRGDVVPLDRVMSAEDVSLSSYPLGYAERLRNAEYDVVVATQHDLFSPWLKQAQWPAMLQQYSIFGRLDGGPHGDVWSEGLGELMGPTGFYERKREQGKHSLSQPERCDFVDAPRFVPPPLPAR
ncbi:MAG: hypothetical protein KC766_11705 [Myxococcales bacterium]|nr:hypothetical protein [Myxococcales bacterium]